MPILHNPAVALVKLETTYATDAAPTGSANFLPVLNPRYTRLGEFMSRKFADGTLNANALDNDLQFPRGSITFDYLMRGNRVAAGADISKGVIANAVEVDPLLRACNFVAIYTPETSLGARDGFVTYQQAVPSNQVGESVTIYLYYARKLHKVTGGKATVSFAATASGNLVATFTVTGYYVNVADAAIPGITWGSPLVNPPRWTQNTLNLGWASPLCARRFSLDIGNKVSYAPCANSGSDISKFMVTDRTPTATLVVDDELEATKAMWAESLSTSIITTEMTVGANVTIPSAGSGNRVHIGLSAQLRDTTYGDQDGIIERTINLMPTRGLTGAEGTEFYIKFS